jgi:hypothetical protein
MIRTRSWRTLAILIATASLLLTTFVGPAAVLGAKVQADATSTPVLTRVSPSIAGGQASYIAYNLSFNLHDDVTSNLSQLYLQAATPTGWTLWAINGEPTTAVCNETGPLFCSFGAYDADDPTITLTVVYKVGTSTGNVTVNFLWTTTGVAGDKKGNSHGDDYPAPATVSVENDADFGASYAQNIGDVISDDTTLNRQNIQFTKITSPATDIVVTVGEDGDISQCQALFGGCFGQASLINVDNGQNDNGPFKVEIGINVNRPSAKFVHFFNTGGFENLGSCGETPVAPCASVTTSNNQTFATIYLNENGKIFGH